MKIKYLFLIIIAVLTNSCSDDLDRSGTYKPDKGITATIPSYPFDDGTRVNISEDLQAFIWSDEDKLGVYYDGTDIQTGIWYTIKQGGSSTGNFSNEVFYLNPTRDYYAFYPFSSTATTLSARIDFTGQVQSGNGSTAHLGAYNYMYGKININTDGGASVPFYNLGSIMQLQLTVPNSVTYTSIDITSDLAKFTTKGVAHMTYGGITATEISDSIHFDFKGDLALNAGDVLIANILIAPVDMSGSTLTFTLTDDYNNTYKVNTAGKNMLQGRAYRYSETVPYKKIEKIPYITFTADAEQTFQMSNSVSTLEYSVNGSIWAELGITQVTFGGSHGDLRLRGKNLSGTASSSSSYSKIQFGNATTKVACSGDIRTLIDYENYNTVSTENARFCYLFSGCSSLTQAPELPATNLADYCYHYMFNSCTSLTSAPELSAANLVGGCYRHMFSGCSSLTQAPELPATDLAQYCYSGMFSGCTALTQAPQLPATNLAYEGYASMFYGCTSLTQAPELPATTLARACYNHMFYGCTSLTQAPELPATTLADRCYNCMFERCTALTQAPELPATTLATYCYDRMFSYCTSLVQAPELPATTLARACYEYMFRGCTSLTQAPELLATDLADNCYSYMFSGCNNLNYIKMMATDISATNCLNGWLNGVLSSTGTFVKNSAATWDEAGVVPEGWSVETASE